ncbi:acyl-CoA thioesterase [Frankia sp. CcWB3]
MPTRFSDMDSFGHLNNVAVASLYEDTRVRLHTRLLRPEDPGGLPGFTPVVAQLSIHYLAEAHYPATYEIGHGISRIGASSFVHSAGLFLDEVCLGLCDTVMVHLVDGVPTPLPPDRRALLESVWFPVRAGGPSRTSEEDADIATSASPASPSPAVTRSAAGGGGLAAGGSIPGQPSGARPVLPRPEQDNQRC